MVLHSNAWYYTVMHGTTQ